MTAVAGKLARYQEKQQPAESTTAPALKGRKPEEFELQELECPKKKLHVLET